MATSVEIIIRTFVAFISLWLFISFLGKQAIAQSTNHGFITAVILGTIAGNMAFNVKIESSLFAIALIMLGGIAFIMTKLSLKSQKARKWIVGTPTVVIENGKILEDNMKKLKYTLDSLNHHLRVKDIFNIEEVEYAVLEVNGTLSVLKKGKYLPVTKADLSLDTSNQQKLPVEVIMDGEIMEDNLIQNELTKEWLLKELYFRKKELSDVFYAVISSKNSLYIDVYNDKITSPIDKE